MVVTMLAGPGRLVPLGEAVVEFRPGVPVEVPDGERARFAKDPGFTIQDQEPETGSEPAKAGKVKGKVRDDG